MSIEITEFLRVYIRFPEIRFPSFDLPADPAEIGCEQIEELAAETRKFWGLGEGPISNVTWLLENHGAVVTRCELGSATLDAFSEWSKTDSTPYVVLGCGKGSAVRSRYDAAHELGHMVMHRHIGKSYLQQHDVFNRIEAQAHRFAGAFLLPRAAFERDLYSPSLDGLRALKESWRVSIAAMIKRAAQLELISESHERRLWVNLGRRKWRTKEPLDDVLDLEAPRFLRRAMELLVTKGIVAPNEVPTRLALAAHDIEELTGLDPGYLSEAGRDIQLVGENNDDKDKEARIIRFPDVN
jgi:Zn-dependent peptidase ImmA (M78 family)